MVILPLTEEAEAELDSSVDDLLHKAQGNLGRLIRLGQKLELKDEVGRIIQEIRPQLPEGDAGNRMAKSYSLLMCLASKVRVMIVINPFCICMCKTIIKSNQNKL